MVCRCLLAVAVMCVLVRRYGEQVCVWHCRCLWLVFVHRLANLQVLYEQVQVVTIFANVGVYRTLQVRGN
jgi:hypothetical protein